MIDLPQYHGNADQTLTSDDPNFQRVACSRSRHNRGEACFWEHDCPNGLVCSKKNLSDFEFNGLEDWDQKFGVFPSEGG